MTCISKITFTNSYSVAIMHAYVMGNVLAMNTDLVIALSQINKATLQCQRLQSYLLVIRFIN